MPMDNSRLKHNVKDSIFHFIFSDAENRRKLYHAIHPEDTDVSAEECELVTLENVLLTDLVNDLGILVRDKLIFLMESQSKFTVNITLRLLIYLAMSYRDYVDERGYSLYSTKPVPLPRPELYMVYVGELRDLPDVLRFSDLYGGNGDIELKVWVLKRTGENNIVDQYIRFCAIVDEQRKIHGYTRKAASEVLRICREENILMPFLQTWEREARDIMVTLFDQEYAMRMFEKEVGEENWQKGMHKGMQKGRQEGRQEGLSEALRSLIAATGYPLEKAMTLLSIPEGERLTYREMLREP